MISFHSPLIPKTLCSNTISSRYQGSPCSSPKILSISHVPSISSSSSSSSTSTTTPSLPLTGSNSALPRARQPLVPERPRGCGCGGGGGGELERRERRQRRHDGRREAGAVRARAEVVLEGPQRDAVPPPPRCGAVLGATSAGCAAGARGRCAVAAGRRGAAAVCRCPAAAGGGARPALEEEHCSEGFCVALG